MELEIADSTSYETVRRVLKNDLKLWLKQQWCIGLEANAQFACQMEQELELYQQLYDPKHPVVYMDEQLKQLIDEVRPPVPTRLWQVAKSNYKYIHHGMCNTLMFDEPFVVDASLWSRRGAPVKTGPNRSNGRLTHHVMSRRGGTLPCDELNMYRLWSLYEAFTPEEALRIVRRLMLVHMTKHGS